MKAVIWTQYGPPEVLQLREVEKPVPGDNDLLIRIHAATVTSGDCEQRALKLPFLLRIPMRFYVGIRKPQRITVLGMDIAGEVEFVGKNVTRFKKGDHVFAATSFMNMGAYAEYICLPAKSEDGAVVLKPDAMTWEEAAGVPTGGIEALYFLRKGNIKTGEKVLINGAGGTIGTFAVQLAKYLGAEVTAVDSADKLSLLQEIGADQVIDYTSENFARSHGKFDVIFDVVGKSSLADSLRILNRGGRFISANPSLKLMMTGRLASITTGKKVIFGSSTQNTDDLEFLQELIRKGKLRSVIDKTFLLEQIVEAHRYVETGHKIGNVVVTMK